MPSAPHAPAMPTTAAVIGTGPDPENPSGEGYAMGYQHADGYEAATDCELVACADVVPENAAAFADAYGLDDDHVYEDYLEMLAEAEPDVVSVCVPPALHADLAIGCIHSGAVEGVHCEKPMAATWGEAHLMAQEADRRGVNLTFNHQRRFGEPFRRAKELLDDGEIGTLERVEYAAGNVYDYGSHSFDLSGYLADESPPEWVLANVDYREENLLFGAHNENQAVVQWKYANGVDGLATTGYGSDLVDAHNRLVGSEGVIELRWSEEETLHVRRDGEGWEAIDTGEEGLHGPDYVERAVEDVVTAVREGGESELCARNALNATELAFGTWESARRRGRVEFPLEIEDNPLEAMVEAGDLAPEPAGDDED